MFMDHNTEREVTGVKVHHLHLKLPLPLHPHQHLHLHLQEHVVTRLREEWGQSQYSEELILRVEGILAVNSVEHRWTLLLINSIILLISFFILPIPSPSSPSPTPLLLPQGGLLALLPVFPAHHLPGLPLLHIKLIQGQVTARLGNCTLDCPNKDYMS